MILRTLALLTLTVAALLAMGCGPV